jgi:2-iminobutanoate/2-iminopropanoate deaminase
MSDTTEEDSMMDRVGIRDPAHFATFNGIYARYFPDDQPARIFLCVPVWPGPFDIEVDCIAVT